MSKHTVRSITLNTWVRKDNAYCFGVSKYDAIYIAEQATAIEKKSVDIMYDSRLITTCNLTNTFTTTCTHLGNVRIARFIEEHGQGTYRAAIEADGTRVIVRILGKKDD